MIGSDILTHFIMVPIPRRHLNAGTGPLRG